MAIQTDVFSEIKPYFREAVERRMRRQDQFGVIEAAGVFSVSATTVRQWIEEGRLLAADLNAGRTAPDEPERALRPYYRITREAMIDLAKRMESGI